MTAPQWTITAPFACYDLLKQVGNTGKYRQVKYPKGVK